MENSLEENTQLDFEKDDYRYMKQAITQAKKAYNSMKCLSAV